MDPVAFTIGPLTIRWYGICVAAAFLIGMWVVNLRARSRSVSVEAASDLVFWSMIGGIGGARLLYVIQYWHNFRDNLLEIVRIDHGGLIFYGGFLGACLAITIVARIKKLPLMMVADLLTPALPLGHAIGRVGCFLNGCCYGHSWNGFTAVTYPLETGAVGPVFPIQLVSSAVNLLIFAGLLAVSEKLKYRGQLFAVYLMVYAISRFLVEFGRGDYHLNGSGVLTPAQVLCIPILLIGLASYWILENYGDQQHSTGE